MFDLPLKFAGKTRLPGVSLTIHSHAKTRVNVSANIKKIMSTNLPVANPDLWSLRLCKPTIYVHLPSRENNTETSTMKKNNVSVLIHTIYMDHRAAFLWRHETGFACFVTRASKTTVNQLGPRLLPVFFESNRNFPKIKMTRKFRFIGETTFKSSFDPYYTFSSRTLFWLTESLQWIFEICINQNLE